MTCVLTSGCFDILTQAHCQLLRECEKLARDNHTSVIVALNTDESISRLKGVSRPIVPYSQRAFVLESLHAVNGIIPLDDDNPTVVVEQLKPAIYVKGGGYTRETMPEWDAVEAGGGRVVLFESFAGLSTTKIVELCYSRNGILTDLDTVTIGVHTISQTEHSTFTVRDAGSRRLTEEGWKCNIQTSEPPSKEFKTAEEAYNKIQSEICRA